MHRYTDIAIKLKEAGFDQKVQFRDYIYILNSGEYAKPNALFQMTPDEYVRVPATVTLVSEFEKLSYSLQHKVVDDKELYILDSGDIHLEDENIWAVFALLWLATRGK
jgi:hypothetical protein